MATGDTVNGSVVGKLVDRKGNEIRVIGPYPIGQVDTFSADNDNKLYLNTMNTSLISPPSNATVEAAPGAAFKAKEKFRVYVIPSSDPGTTIDVSGADSQMSVRYLENDLNRGGWSVETFDLSDNENSTEPEPTGNIGSELLWFEETIEDQLEVLIAGAFEAAPSET